MPKTILFDPVNQMLLIEGERVQVSPKAFSVLDYLYQHRQQLVSKDDLLTAVWPKVFVTDAVLKVAVGELRKALNDHPKQPTYIETVHRRGYRFIGEMSQPATTVPVSQAVPENAGFLVGRDDLLQQLTQAWGTAKGGQKQLLFLQGEAGLGKTAVINHWLEQQFTDNADCLVATTGCFDQRGSSEPYLPILDALGALLNSPQQAGVKKSLRQYAPGWFFQIPSLIQAEDKEVLKQELFGVTTQRMLREFVDFIEALTQTTPLLLCIEDLHWCDVASLDLIMSLAQRRNFSRFMLLGSFRSSELRQDDSAFRSVYSQLSLHQQCRSIVLPALTRDEVSDWLQQRLPEALQTEEYTDLFYRYTEGSPLLLYTTIEHLHQSGALVANSGDTDAPEVTPHLIEQGISGGLQHLLTLKTAGLDRDDRQLLEAASVSNAEFSTESLAAVLQKDVLDIEEACEGKLLYEQWLIPDGSQQWPDGSISESYHFWHQLYRQFFYDALSAARRRHYHLRFAERLLQGYRGELTKLAAQLAYHFEAGGDIQRAIELRLLASEQASQRFAYREAIQHITRVIELTENAEDKTGHLEARKQCCHFLLASGQLPEVMAGYRELIQVSQQAGAATQEIEATLGLADALFWVDRQACLDTAKQAVVLSQQGDDAALQVHAQGKYIHFRSVLEGYKPEYAEAYEAGLALAQNSDDPAVKSVHYARHLYYLSIQSRYAEANELAVATSQIALDRGDAVSYLSAEFFHAWGLFYQGEWDDMFTVIERALALAQKNAHTPWVLHFQLQKAWLLTQAGDFAGARELCLPIYEQVRAGAAGSLYFFSLIILIQLETGAEQPEASQAYVSEVTERLEQNPLAIDWVLKFTLQQGLAEFWLRQEVWDKAREAALELQAQAACSGEQTYQVMADYFLARCALGEKDDQAGKEHLERAEVVLQQQELPVVAWRVAALSGQDAGVLKPRLSVATGGLN